MNGEKRMEEMDFGPRLPFVRITFTLLAFAFLTWAAARETAARLEYAEPTPGIVAETIFIALMLFAFGGGMTSYLLLPVTLRFTEEGIRRKTILAPRFVPWSAVRSAKIGTYRGYFALEMWIGKYRWITIPLLQYRRGDALLAEIRKRLPVEVAASEKETALLRDG